jgi:hypothetical protein
VVKEFLEARRITRLLEAREPSILATWAAVAGYRNVHDYLAERYVGLAGRPGRRGLRRRRVEGSPGLLPKAIVPGLGARVCDGTVTDV